VIERSTESLKWLNSQILVGFTDDKKPWWYSEALQGGEPTIYSGAVPLEDVKRRIFDWEAIRCPIKVDLPNRSDVLVPKMYAIVNSKTGHIFKIASDNYVIHQYQDWLVKRVAALLDNGNLQIGSAGLLRKGAGAFVTVETPENVKTRSGMEIKPKLLAASSHDSKLASIYKFVSTIVVCDNTLNAALAEHSNVHRVRHTENSLGRLEDVRKSLDIVIAGPEGMVDFLDSLSEIKVSESQWQEIVDRLVPVPDSSRPQVVARLENKRLELDNLWRNDLRCSPWHGSGLGVFQAFNTHNHHIAGQDASRFDRNMRKTLSNSSLKEDRKILDVLNAVTGASVGS
jgi:phage/plasmid-like protein (TIGR03299 family)